MMPFGLDSSLDVACHNCALSLCVQDQLHSIYVRSTFDHPGRDYAS
jgi:hypothetical protein